MIIKNLYFRMGILVFLLTSGCAADRHAQDLGKEILIQVVEYDNAIQGVSRIMKDNYGKRKKSIQKAMFREQGLVIEAITDRLTVEAVEHVVLRGFLTSDLRNYIIAVQDAKRVKELQYEAALASYNAKHQALLNKLTLEQQELKTVKSALETLQSPVSTQEQIQQLIPLFQAAYEAQKESQKNIKDTKAETTTN